MVRYRPKDPIRFLDGLKCEQKPEDTTFRYVSTCTKVCCLKADFFGDFVSEIDVGELPQVPFGEDLAGEAFANLRSYLEHPLLICTAIHL